MEHLFNYCLKLASEIVLATKKEYSPNGVVDDAVCGGDPPATSTNESTRKILDAYVSHLPALFNATTSQIQPTEQAKLAATQATSPGYAQLQQDLYSQYGPQQAAVQANIANSNKLASAQGDLGVLQGPGKDLVSTALGLDKTANPELYAARAAAGGKLTDLLGSIDPNKLTGGEQAQIERGINATNRGYTDAPSAIGTAQNAMTFGSALTARQNHLADVIGTATNFLQGARSNFDPLQIALGRPSINSAAPGAPAPTTPGNEAFSFGGNFLQGLTGLQSQANQITSQRRDSLDRVNQTLSSMPSY